MRGPRIHPNVPWHERTYIHAPMDDGSCVSQARYTAVELQVTSYLSPYFYSVGKGDIKLLLSRQFRAIRETRPCRCLWLATLFPTSFQEHPTYRWVASCVATIIWCRERAREVRSIPGWDIRSVVINMGRKWGNRFFGRRSIPLKMHWTDVSLGSIWRRYLGYFIE